ncbi:MAG TPA: histidine kinase dimerization/phospho-acceptor domain-containing protein, partial [Dehalococcoidia bacterium]|nr:histidine kinase dimerization/phospho-acceptor domain-containing protein [Dehalococcoidia bacterium]
MVRGSVRRTAPRLQQLQEFLENIDQPIFSLDLAGRFILVNSACASARGLARHELIGRHYAETLQDSELGERMVDAASRGEIVSERLDLRRSDGAVTTVVERLGPWRNNEGQISAVWGVAAEAETYDRLAAIRAETEVLRELDEARANLLSIVSHELRTPLASIQGYASTYLLYEDRLEPEERRGFLRRIVDSTLQLEELVDNLLTASRIEHGTLELSLRPAQLSKLVLETISEAHQRWESEQIEFSGPDRCELVLDPRRIRQVMHNLLDNARKYGGEGPIEVELEDQGQHVWLTVRDH